MKKLNIIYEDKSILVVDKNAGLLTIATDKIRNHTLYHEVREYIKKVNPKIKIFIVHRLDKDTSGLVVFAKSEMTKKYLQDNWESFNRIYYAVCHGKITNKGTIKSYLAENKALLVYSTSDKTKGKLAITNYEPISSNKLYTLVKIDIKTGRKNQIRVHMSDINHSIVGDKKYGFDKGIKRLMLHASTLTIIHPVTKKSLTFTSKIPKEFNKYYEKNTPTS